jgi:hypothetical protein
VYWAHEELLPIAIEAPADRKTRDKWLNRLWQAIEDDGVDCLSLVQDRWGVRQDLTDAPCDHLGLKVEVQP